MVILSYFNILILTSALEILAAELDFKLSAVGDFLDPFLTDSIQTKWSNQSDYTTNR